MVTPGARLGFTSFPYDAYIVKKYVFKKLQHSTSSLLYIFGIMISKYSLSLQHTKAISWAKSNLCLLAQLIAHCVQVDFTDSSDSSQPFLAYQACFYCYRGAYLTDWQWGVNKGFKAFHNFSWWPLFSNQSEIMTMIIKDLIHLSTMQAKPTTGSNIINFGSRGHSFAQ